ncbi:MAG: hypothetical protein GEV11_02410 [Streptosporangiales bacterium]|nr:hypothetical protein [Streptosporangiales bacterium]
MTRTTSLLADDLLTRLRPLGDAARAVNEKRYLKSDLEFLGVPVPGIRRTVGALHREHPGLTHAGLVAVVTELWSRPVHELRMATVELLTGYRGLLTVADLPLVEGLIRTSGTWAYVDGLAEKVAAGIVRAQPEGLAELDHWARDPDFWVRRAAMLALLPGLKDDGTSTRPTGTGCSPSTRPAPAPAGRSAAARPVPARARPGRAAARSRSAGTARRAAAAGRARRGSASTPWPARPAR